MALLFILDDNRCCCHKSATESTCLMAIQFSLSLYIASAASKLGCRPRCRRSVSTPMAHHACLAANPCTEGKIGAIHDWDVRIKSWKTTRVIFLAGHFIVSASLTERLRLQSHHRCRFALLLSTYAAVPPVIVVAMAASSLEFVVERVQPRTDARPPEKAASHLLNNRINYKLFYTE